MIHTFNTEQFLKTDLESAWKFFSSAKNLGRITPPEMEFKILTDLPDEEIYDGMLINYTVKPLFGIGVRWQTEIYQVRRPFKFVDRQLRGPYSIWEHTHIFTEQNGGVLVTDDVKYKLPLGFLGWAAHSLLVRQKIIDIFAYRRRTLETIFNS